MTGRASRVLERILRCLGSSSTPFRRITPAQVLVVGFAVVILVGALLLSLPIASTSGRPTGFVDSLFTATSAVCVTGLVVVDTGTYWSLFGQIVIMTLIQIGGLGFMTLSTMVALFLGRRIGLRERLVIQESLGQLSLEGMVRLILAVLTVTVVFEGAGFLILGIHFSRHFGLARGLYYGLFHSVSAFCNAGFDILGGFQSLTNYTSDPVVLITIGMLLVLGGLGFAVIIDLRHLRRSRQLVLHSRLVLMVTTILIVVGTLGILALEHNNSKTMGAMGGGEKILNAWFQAVSPRTAGFNSVAIDGLTRSSIFLLVILMFIGASPGSTGGGIKTTTFGIIMATLWSLIRGKDDVVLFGRKVPVLNLIKGFCVAIAAILLVVGMTFLLTLTEKVDFLSLLFEVTSAFGTVGLSMGITPSLSTLGRILIIITMFAGRVGPLTIATALGRRRKTPPAIHYPEERVTVG
jgi:trk system potassium uptake protein TrkH